ncbi:chaperonin 10-like protein [Aspergillus karnatakaensis]|uniref:chaperonin 10-like protein n=1 Tax=Aspergillus karnatakaensis TaxID=1810916 RepID=UPI003CCDDCE7
MRAAQFHAAGDIRVEDIPAPNATSDHNKVLIEVEWCGICGSDLNEYVAGPFLIPSTKRGPHPLTNAMLPITMGHEFTGRIIHIPGSSSGRECTGARDVPLKIGQAVVVDPRYYCSACSRCNQDATNCCEKFGFLGLSGGGGLLSEVVAVNPKHVYILSESVPEDLDGSANAGKGIDLAAAALIEPLATAWHAVRLYAATSTSSVHRDLSTTPALVIGAGPVGVAVAFVLRAFGAQTILVSEPSRARREVIFGTRIVSAAYNPADDNVSERCAAETGGEGVGVVFDCAGTQEGFEAGCDSLRFRGGYVNLAVPKKPLTLPLGSFMTKELTYRSSLSYDEKDFGEVVDAFVAGRFTGIEKMISRRVILEDIVERGFKELVKPNDHVKILATPKDENLKSK